MNKKLKDSVNRKGLCQLSQVTVILHKRLVHTARQAGTWAVEPEPGCPLTILGVQTIGAGYSHVISNKPL